MKTNAMAASLQESPGKDSPARMLIVRLSALGDTVHTLPLAAALRDALPGVFIGWVVEEPSRTLVENNPAIDWVRVLPKGWLKKPGEVLRLRRDLRAMRFSHAFDVQGLTKSAVAAWLSGAKMRIGFTRVNRAARELAPFLDNVRLGPEGRHVVDQTLSLLRGIGLEPPAVGRFVLPPCSERDRLAIREVETALKNRDIPAPGFVVMGPWASERYPGKRWPLERFGLLARVLLEKYGLPSLFLAHGEKEQGAVRELAADYPEAVLPAPDLALTGVAALAGRARLFVGCDSFPLHAAYAAGCPCVGLFGITDPERVGPYGGTGLPVYDLLVIPKSRRERESAGRMAMRNLSVPMVLAACAKVLEAARRSDAERKTP